MINFYCVHGNKQYEIDTAQVKKLKQNIDFDEITYKNVNYISPQADMPSYKETFGIVYLSCSIVKHQVSKSCEGGYQLTLSEYGYYKLNKNKHEDIIYMPIFKCCK